MSARRYLILMTLLAGFILLAGNIAAQRLLAGARLDFTEGRLYTLSEATRSVLADLAEPVDITLVYSRRAAQDYPAIQAHASRVREMLAAYAAASRGQLRIHEIDPRAFSEDEDRALAAGVAALPARGADPLYLGIIGENTVDDVRVMPFLAPEREATLEYDLTRMIARLDNPDPPRIGILSSLPGMAVRGPEGGYAVRQEIERLYEVEPIEPNFDTLPDNLDALLIVHPPELSSWQEWQIDQFLLARGRAVFVVDPAAKTALSGGAFSAGLAPPRSGLGRFGEAWGVRLAPEAVADAAHALPVPVETGAGRIEEISHPLFIGIPARQMSQDDLITADLMREVYFGAPGALIARSVPEGATFDPLITTGPSPSFIDAARAARDISPAETLRAYRAEPDALVIAGRLIGRLRTAFPAGPPALDLPDDPARAETLRAAQANAPPALRESALPADIVIFADADFLSDDFYIVPGSGLALADNGSLLLNALDAISGSTELSRLRSRAPGLRPMSRIDRLREAAEAQYFRQQDALERRLDEAQARLTALQAAGIEEGAALTDPAARLDPADREEMSRLRENIVSLRASLRAIERDYRRDIDRMETALKALNIWGGPILIMLAGFFVWRSQRRAQGRPS